MLFCAVARVVVLGERALPAGPVILACNHISHFDPPLVGSRFNRKVDFMAMEELFRAPWARRMLAGWMDAFPVRRGQPDSAAVREAVRRLRAGRVVGIFPEGGLRSGAASVLGGAPLPPGAAVLAQMGGAVIVPVVVMGTDQLYLWKNWLRRPLLFVAAGPPLALQEGLDRAAAREDLNNRLRDAWWKLAAQIRARDDFHDGIEPRTAQERWGMG